MGKKAGKKGVGQQQEARRKRYADERIKKAIKEFFSAIDEDGNGFLELHEFVVAQGVIAELSGESFDDEAYERSYDQVKAFDTDNDSKISLKEFEVKIKELCEAIPKNSEEIIGGLAEKVAQVVSHTRREVGSEIRQLFRAIDHDHSNSLDPGELQQVIQLAQELGAQQGPEAQRVVERMGDLNHLTLDDGKVDVTEFCDFFLSCLREARIPKRDCVERLRELKDSVLAAEVAADVQSNLTTPRP